MFRRSTMRPNIIILAIFMTFSFVSCQKPEEAKPGTIIGSINTGVPGAVKVQLQNASDASDMDIAFSEQDGSFVFQDVKEGFYYITPTKDGYSWIWTVIGDNDPIHRNSPDKRIKVGAGEIVKVKILMSPSNGEALSILTAQGDPIDKLVINNGMGSVSFVLFNGTGTTRSYSIVCRCLFKETFDAFYLFTSINPSSGSLAPGESVLITCSIDPRVYSSALALYDDIEISYNMKLPISLNWNLLY